MLDLIEELRSILSALEAARVEVAVCGGLAVAIHARPRATLDVDLLLPREQADRAKQIVRGLGYQIEADPMVFGEGAVEIHCLSKPDPETGDLLSLSQKAARLGRQLANVRPMPGDQLGDRLISPLRLQRGRIRQVGEDQREDPRDTGQISHRGLHTASRQAQLAAEGPEREDRRGSGLEVAVAEVDLELLYS